MSPGLIKPTFSIIISVVPSAAWRVCGERQTTQVEPCRGSPGVLEKSAAVWLHCFIRFHHNLPKIVDREPTGTATEELRHQRESLMIRASAIYDPLFLQI